MATVTMTMEEYMNLLNGLTSDMGQMSMDPEPVQTKPKRRTTAYQRKYKAAFKKIAPRYKLKSGRWKKNGFKMAVREAHKMARK